MIIQEARDILNKLSPDELGFWETNWQQMLVQTTTLEVPVSIDIQEIDGLSDDKIKGLIHDRIVSALKDKLFTEQEKTNATR